MNSPKSNAADNAEVPNPCWPCLTGDGEHTEAWHYCQHAWWTSWGVDHLDIEFAL